MVWYSCFFFFFIYLLFWSVKVFLWFCAANPDTNIPHLNTNWPQLKSIHTNKWHHLLHHPHRHSLIRHDDELPAAARPSSRSSIGRSMSTDSALSTASSGSVPSVWVPLWLPHIPLIPVFVEGMALYIYFLTDIQICCFCHWVLRWVFEFWFRHWLSLVMMMLIGRVSLSVRVTALL